MLNTDIFTNKNQEPSLKLYKYGACYLSDLLGTYVATGTVDLESKMNEIRETRREAWSFEELEREYIPVGFDETQHSTFCTDRSSSVWHDIHELEIVEEHGFVETTEGYLARTMSNVLINGQFLKYCLFLFSNPTDYDSFLKNHVTAPSIDGGYAYKGRFKVQIVPPQFEYALGFQAQYLFTAQA